MEIYPRVVHRQPSVTHRCFFADFHEKEIASGIFKARLYNFQNFNSINQ